MAWLWALVLALAPPALAASSVQIPYPVTWYLLLNDDASYILAPGGQLAVQWVIIDNFCTAGTVHPVITPDPNNGAALINGQTSFTLTENCEAINLLWDGSNWHIN